MRSSQNAQPLGEGARQRRRMDPRCGLKAGMSGWGLGTASDLRLEYRFWASPFTKIGAWVLPYIACLKRISPLSFIPPVPYPPLRGTFPSRGRLRYENTIF